MIKLHETLYFIIFLAAVFSSFRPQGAIASDINFHFKYRLRFDLWNGLNKKAYGDSSIFEQGTWLF